MEPILNDWIITASGIRFELGAPTPDMVCIEDIAQALARQTRFNGHTGFFYSVAMHSILVARHLPQHLQLEGLLHDAAEAYIGDINGPLKRIIKSHWPGFKDLETRIEQCIFDALGIPLTHDPLIKEIDLRMLAVEKRELMPRTPDEWTMLKGVIPMHRDPLMGDVDLVGPNKSMNGTTFAVATIFLDLFKTFKAHHDAGK